MKKKELLFSVYKKDFEVQTFRAGGKGGQKQNKTSSGVRIIHKESGAVGEARNTRSQYQNKKLALARLIKHPKWKIWFNKKCYEVIEGKRIEEIVEEKMKPENIIVEMKKEGKWVPYEER